MSAKNGPLSVALIRDRLRERGIMWVLGAGIAFLNRKLVPEAGKVGWANMRDWLVVRNQRVDDVLYAFYDLSVYGFSYDFIVYLLLADSQRRKQKLASVHIVIVPGKNGGFRSSPSEANDLGEENLLWRLRNLLIPSCWLLPHCSGVTVCGSRQEAVVIRRRVARHVFPTGYTDSFSRKRDSGRRLVTVYNQGAPLPQLRARPAAKHYVEQWIKAHAAGRKIITITLREATYSKERNSNLEAWVTFINSLNTDVYCPIIVRDTERALDRPIEGLGNALYFSEACWNIELRLALYELSFINMMVNNGPGALVLFGTNIRFLYFKVLTPQFRSTSAAFYKKDVGIEPGHSFPWSTRWQRWIWEDDSFAVITREFRKMCADIEAASQPGGGPSTGD